MKLNKSVVGLAVAVVGLSFAAQAPAVFAKQKANEHSPVSVTSVAISEATATATAQGLLAGTVKSSHLSMERGTATWSIRILSTDGSQRGDFRIDANTGVVLKSVIKPVGTKHANQIRKLELAKKHLEQKGQKSGN